MEIPLERGLGWRSPGIYSWVIVKNIWSPLIMMGLPRRLPYGQPPRNDKNGRPDGSPLQSIYDFRAFPQSPSLPMPQSCFPAPHND